MISQHSSTIIYILQSVFVCVYLQLQTIQVDVQRETNWRSEETIFERVFDFGLIWWKRCCAALSAWIICAMGMCMLVEVNAR